MKLLVTGAKGFVGKNLIAELKNIQCGKSKNVMLDESIEIFECDLETSKEELEDFASKCDFVFHLAGINRPKNVDEFMEGNFGFTSELLDCLKKHENKAPILMSSSIQAELDNDYGKSKRAGEVFLRDYGRAYGISTFIFRLPNVFGKWSKPNYNSAVATFCHNIARGLPITVSDRKHALNLVYIDDVVNAFLNVLSDNVEYEKGYCSVPISYNVTLGQIVDLLENFKKQRENLQLPNMKNAFEKKLYSTYLSFLPTDSFSYCLNSHEDARGSFTEFLHTENNGQISVNISKPHIVKGQHWHNTKNEKFLVVSGKGVIRFREIGSTEVVEYFVSGEKLEVVDIPCGYTHNIENLGDSDMVTIMWCNEIFNPNKPDTFFEEV